MTAPPSRSELSSSVVATDTPWEVLKRFTPARIALGRCGSSLPSRQVLAFGLAHAQARDAIHLPLDVKALAAALTTDGWSAPLCVHTRAPDRQSYLLRPDWGRRLDDASVGVLQDARRRTEAPDLALVIGDGLSALGVQRYTPALLRAIRDALDRTWRVAPLVIVQQARVAVGDEVGELLGAGMVAMIIGERPGLSSPDSVGIYLTLRPRVGCTDAQRNCISNIRVGGQDVVTAARRFAWLAQEARRLQTTGVGLKDHSGLPLIGVFSEEPRRA
jgi:ethanolamine ammonia-lyase small subunit